MPIYEYACSACGKRTEILHGINDPAPSFCPECGAEGSLRKGFAAPAVVFKGSGWAKKDRRPTSSGKGRDDKDGSSDAKPGDSKPAEAASSGPESSTSSSSSSSTSTDKPAAKASEGA